MTFTDNFIRSYNQILSVLRSSCCVLVMYEQDERFDVKE